MKKILIILIILYGFLIAVSFKYPDLLTERKIEGTIIAVSRGNFSGFEGNFIVWEKERAATKWYEQGDVYRVWFIYPPQEELNPPVKIQLIYKWTQRVADIPIVQVITLKKIH